MLLLLSLLLSLLLVLYIANNVNNNFLNNAKHIKQFMNYFENRNAFSIPEVKKPHATWRLCFWLLLSKNQPFWLWFFWPEGGGVVMCCPFTTIVCLPFMPHLLLFSSNWFLFSCNSFLFSCNSFSTFSSSAGFFWLSSSAPAQESWGDRHMGLIMVGRWLQMTSENTPVSVTTVTMNEYVTSCGHEKDRETIKNTG